MNNSKILGLIAVIFITISIFSSCTKDNFDETNTTQTETSSFDCPTLEVNFGDTCSYPFDTAGVTITLNGTIDTDCNCTGGSLFDCPNLELNYGSSCTTSNGEQGSVNSNCECEADSTTTYDCPSLSLNIGDPCYASNGALSTVDADCNCLDPNGVDCPAWDANIGDSCMYYDVIQDTMNNTLDTILINGVLDVNCDCL